MQRKERNKGILQVGRKVAQFAAAILLIASLGFGTALAVSSDLRVTVMKLLYNVTPQYAEILLVPDENASFTVPADWQGDYFPSYIPNGYVFSNIQGTKSMRDATYYAPDEKVLVFSENDAATNLRIDTEGYEVQEIVIRDSAALLAHKEGKSSVMWSEGNKSFFLTISEDAETALRVARSVQRIEK